MQNNTDQRLQESLLLWHQYLSHYTLFFHFCNQIPNVKLLQSTCHESPYHESFVALKIDLVDK
ncbi:TPA: hypothetical protein ACGM23_000069 [Streptococcus agalactiae]|uniref:hypothetical protein n=1 Tax=Streptococcus agalactiae TaxID=1311 RepID=UPI00370632BA